MVGDVQGHRRRHLHRLVLGAAGSHGGICTGLAGGIGLVHRVLAGRGVGRGSAADILRAQSVGGGRKVVGTGGLSPGSAVSVVIGVLVQTVVDVGGSIVLGIAAPQIRFVPGALRDLVGLRLGIVGTGTELAEDTLHVGAHGGGQTEAVVLVEGVGRDAKEARHIQLTVHIHIDMAVHDVDGNGGAHGGLFAGGEGTGLAEGAALLDGLQPHAQKILRGRPGVCQLLFLALAAVGIVLEERFIKAAHVQIVGAGADNRAGADEAPDVVVAEIQRRGGVDGIGLAVVGDLAAGGSRAGGAGIVVTGNGIGTGHGNGGGIVAALGADVQRAALHDAVFADAGLTGHVAVVQGEGGAHADAAAALVGGGRLVDELLFAGIELAVFRLDYQPLTLGQFGHIEGKDIARGIFLGGDGLRRLGDVVFHDKVAQSLQSIVCGTGIHGDENLLTAANLRGVGLPVLAGADGGVAAAHTADGRSVDRVHGTGVLKEGHRRDHGIRRHAVTEFGEARAQQIEHVGVVLICRQSNRLAIVAAGQSNGSYLIARIGSNGHFIMGIGLCKGINLAVVAAGHDQIALTLLFGVLGGAAAVGLVGGAAGAKVPVNGILGTHGGTGHGVFLLDGLAAKGEIAAHGDVMTAARRHVPDQRLSGAVDDSHGDGTRHTHVAGARAGDGMGNEAVARRGFRGFGPELQQRGESIQSAGGEGLAYILEHVDGVGPDGLKRAVFEEGLQLGHVEDAGEDLIGNVGGHSIKLRAERQRAGVGVIGDRTAAHGCLNLGEHHVEDGIYHVLFDALGNGGAQIGQTALDLLLDVGGNQVLQPGAVQQSQHRVADHLTDLSIFTEELVIEGGPELAKGLLQIQSLGHFIEDLFEGLIQQLLNDGVALIVLQGDNLLEEILVHEGGDFHILGGDGGVANDGQVIIGDHVDGHSHAHADLGIGGAGIAVNGGDGAVGGVDRDLFPGVDDNTAVDNGLGHVLLHVQHKGGRHLGIALGGLGQLTVLNLAAQRAGREIAGTGVACQSDAVADGLVGLLICFRFGLLLCRVSLPGG